jgi:hypothetical protein
MRSVSCRFARCVQHLLSNQHETQKRGKLYRSGHNVLETTFAHRTQIGDFGPLQNATFAVNVIATVDDAAFHNGIETDSAHGTTLAFLLFRTLTDRYK